MFQKNNLALLAWENAAATVVFLSWDIFFNIFWFSHSLLLQKFKLLPEENIYKQPCTFSILSGNKWRAMEKQNAIKILMDCIQSWTLAG